MSNLGLGVMIQMLGGNKESVECFRAAIGKTIAGIEISQSDDGWHSGADTLAFTFDDGSRIGIRDEGQSCCEHRYMHTDDELSDFVGAELLGAEIRGGDSESGEYGDCKDSQFLVVQTSLGEFTVVNYNEHNGYYGGFWVVAVDLTPEDNDGQD